MAESPAFIHLHEHSGARDVLKAQEIGTQETRKPRLAPGFSRVIEPLALVFRAGRTQEFETDIGVRILANHGAVNDHGVTRVVMAWSARTG